MPDEYLKKSEYVQQAGRLMAIPITPEALPGVIEQIEHLGEMAALVTTFPFPESLQVLPVFEP